MHTKFKNLFKWIFSKPNKKVLSQSNKNKWPISNYDENDQPHFLFILTPPCSGSTALSELINTSQRTMTLQPRGEGQWLVPGMSEKGRWNPAKEINYNSIKSTWLSVYQKTKQSNPKIEVVIEKSPPNMMRMKQLSAQFRNCSFIANNRNPYANCASILYRLYEADELNSEKRKNILRSLVKSWIMRSMKIQELISDLKAPLLTYEEFCRNPSSVIKILNLPAGVTESINPDAIVRVKDYKPQPIKNQNERQIANLTDEEISLINDVLKPHNQLLEYFGYNLCQKQS